LRRGPLIPFLIVAGVPFVARMALVSGTVATSAGCPAVSNTAVLPITGITIDIQDLLAGANLNCGTGPGDVYEYAAIVDFNSTGVPPPIDKCGEVAEGKVFSPGTTVAGGVFQCFSQGTLGNLPFPDGGFLPDGGSQLYQVQIYFFTQEAAVRYETKIQAAVQPGIPITPICQIPTKAHPAWSWATTCTAIETDNIIVHPACEPIVLPALTDSGSPDAAMDVSSDVHADAPPDATDATDATDAEGLDAPTDSPTDARD
jgi:hypothetical protein